MNQTFTFKINFDDNKNFKFNKPNINGISIYNIMIDIKNLKLINLKQHL